MLCFINGCKEEGRKKGIVIKACSNDEGHLINSNVTGHSLISDETLSKPNQTIPLPTSLYQGIYLRLL